MMPTGWTAKLSCWEKHIGSHSCHHLIHACLTMCSACESWKPKQKTGSFSWAALRTREPSKPYFGKTTLWTCHLVHGSNPSLHLMLPSLLDIWPWSIRKHVLTISRHLRYSNGKILCNRHVLGFSSLASSMSSCLFRASAHGRLAYVIWRSNVVPLFSVWDLDELTGSIGLLFDLV